MKNSQVEASLFDCKGRLIFNKKGEYTRGIHSVSLENISAGVYLFKFKADNMEKLIKICIK